MGSFQGVYSGQTSRVYTPEDVPGYGALIVSPIWRMRGLREANLRGRPSGTAFGTGFVGRHMA